MKKITLILILVSNQLFAAATTWINRPQGTDIIPDGRDYNVKISRNGRYVAFSSSSANLVDNDNNINYDLFVKDTQTDEITLVNRTQNGIQILLHPNPTAIYFSQPTSDGKYIAFISKDPDLPMATGSYLLYMKNLMTGEITAETYNNGQEPIESSSDPILSDDAKYIYFRSGSDILAIDNNIRNDLYRKNRQTNTFDLINISTITGQAITDTSDTDLLDVSENGRYVAFESESAEIHPQATLSNNDSVGYIRDLQFNTTQIFSVNTLFETVYSNNGYETAIVSNTGTVYFCSNESTLVDNDNNGFADYFKYELGIISRLQYAGINTEISDYGCVRFGRPLVIDTAEEQLLFIHTSNELSAQAIENRENLFSLDLTTMDVELLSIEDGNAYEVIGRIGASSDHSKVVFSSYSVIVLEPTGSSHPQSFLLDLETSLLEQIATPNHLSLTQNNNIDQLIRMSDNQNYFIYKSKANNILPFEDFDNLSDLYYFNKPDNTTTKIAYDLKSDESASISPDGKYVVFSSSLFHPITTIKLKESTVFLLDLQTQQYIQIAAGLSPSVNNDGDIVFTSENALLVNNDNNSKQDIFYYNFTAQTISRVNVNSSGQEANGHSYSPQIAGSGLSIWIVYHSSATNLIANDLNVKGDVFLHNWPLGNVFRISEVAGIGGTDKSSNPAISTDTTKILFYTKSDNIIGSTTNKLQLIMYDRVSTDLTLISKDEAGLPSTDFVLNYGVSNNGKYVAFSTDGPLLINDTNNEDDIYLYDTESSLMRQITSTEDHDYVIMHDIAVDESFDTDKLGILYVYNNEVLADLYGYYNVPDFHSAFLYQEGGDGETLSLEITGDGQITGALGLNCQTNCSQVYPIGQEFPLIAIVGANQAFVGWTGECLNHPVGNDQICEVRMDQNKTIQATFLESNDRIFISGFE